MIINGTIKQVFPPDYTDPKWHNQYQNIVVDTVSGDMTGRIGCKKPYTQQDIGSQGQWECVQDTNAQGAYNKFKKYNPQYPDQATPQQSQQAPQQPKTPPSNKDRLIVAQVVYKELSSKFADVEEFDIWIMGDGHNVLSRHIDSIMLLGSYKTADGEPNF